MSDTTLVHARPRAVELSEVAPAVPARLTSLDVFRGLTVAAMLLVNNPGSWSHVYPQLRHAEWHGWTATDLIFPFFLFIVGVSTTLSFARLRERGVPPRALLVKAARRAAILVALGLVLQSFPWWELDPSRLRLPGVLQRIGLAYLAAAPAVLWLAWRGRAAVAGALLLGYWAAMRWVPVPGTGAGVWEPGRDLGAYLDRAVFGTHHLWAQSRTWDPEGLFSTLPAVATVLLGVMAGEWIRSARPPRERVLGLLAAGAAGVGAGLLWGTVFPINKPLWTSSYALFTAGAAALLLGALHGVVDVRGWRRWGFPFLLFGVNAIAAFFLSSLGARLLGYLTVGDGRTVKGWIFESWFAPHLRPIDASLAFALAYVLFWTGVMWLLWRRRILLKI